MKEKKRPKNRGITRRWILGSLFWTILILVIGIFAVLYSLRENYYSQARTALAYRVKQAYDLVPSALEMGEAARAQTARKMVEEFAEGDRYEFMLVGPDGSIVLTSSGFAFNPEEPVDDYFEAWESDDLTGSFMGRSVDGEHILAYTKLFAYPIRGNITGIRMVTSLRLVDEQLLETSYVLIFVCVLVLFFSIFSGSYFVRSIVQPIRQIGNTARRISDGDFDVRIENRYNDEIGALSDIINEMAVGLSAADRMKNDFISSVSHELRTPLTAIKGWGETLLATPPSDRETYERGMRVIMNEADRLGYMVEDLIDVSRMQTGALSVKREPADVVAELSEAMMTYERRAEGLGIKLVYEEPQQPAAVFADRRRMRQVFNNLLENAIKYSRAGDTVTVTAECDKKTLTVSVGDTGIGIPDEEVSHVTERFFRASNSATGSGIGLSVVKEIVEKHDGELLIESVLGEGTTISVKLPLMG